MVAAASETPCRGWNRPRRPWRRYFAIAGPGALVAVGYVDPGNWATDLAGGSRYSYSLLFVVVASGLVAMLFQSVSARLGIATGQDLAVLTRLRFPRAAWLFWVAAEIAVIATDLAEVLGSAVALELLFAIPLGVGVVLTAFDVMVLMLLERHGSKLIERVVVGMMIIVAAALAYELALSRPPLGALLRGLLPTSRIVRDPAMLFAAIGIVGATIMPHNLYLHSSLVLPRFAQQARGSKRRAAKLAVIDTIRSLSLAIVLNGALVALAASVFYAHGREDIATLGDAYRLLSPLLGSAIAPAVFALALLAAGQSATLTATMAGQVIMAGLLGIRWPVWQRRLVTRAFAIVPALAVIWVGGEKSTGTLLILSQVVLSLQLPFAMVPLMLLTGDVARMGQLVNPAWVKMAGWLSVALIVVSNGALIVSFASP